MLKNIFTLIFIFPALFIMGLLTGCGGGGGGSSSVPANPFVKWSAITPPETVVASGISQITTFPTSTPIPILLTETTSPVNTTTTASIKYLADGSIGALTITSPQGSISWDEASGDIIDDSSAIVTFYGTNGSAVGQGYAANAIDPLFNWEYQTFGGWLVQDFNSSLGAAAPVSVGSPTAGSAIPTSGSATFTGVASGMYATITGGRIFVTASDLSVNADFLNRSLALTTSNTSFVPLGNYDTRNLPDIDMAGTLTYAPASNSFTGTLITNHGSAGTTTGRFYGPAAEELGGVFTINGGATELYTGAYGAKR